MKSSKHNFGLILSFGLSSFSGSTVKGSISIGCFLLVLASQTLPAHGESVGTFKGKIIGKAAYVEPVRSIHYFIDTDGDGEADEGFVYTGSTDGAGQLNGKDKQVLDKAVNMKKHSIEITTDPSGNVTDVTLT